MSVNVKFQRELAEKGPSVHMVSAFTFNVSLVLDKVKAAWKINQVTAIPVLLDTLYRKDFLFSIDAMGFQNEVDSTVIAKSVDYLLAVKVNQPSLQAAIETIFIDRKTAASTVDHVEAGQGRFMGARAHLVPSWVLVDPVAWSKYTMIGCTVSYRVVCGKNSAV